MSDGQLPGDEAAVRVTEHEQRIVAGERATDSEGVLGPPLHRHRRWIDPVGPAVSAMIEVDQPEVRRQRVQRAVWLQVDTQPAVQDQRRRSVAELFDVQAYAVDVDQ